MNEEILIEIMEDETLFYAVKINDVVHQLDLLTVWNYKTPNKVKLSSSTTRRTFGVFHQLNLFEIHDKYHHERLELPLD